MKSLEERLSKLESSSRRWRLAALGMGAALLCVTAMGAKLKSQNNVLRVRGIEVVNDDGECLVKIGVRSGGVGSIETFNNRGKRATIVTSNNRGDGLLEISNNGGKRVFAVAASTRGDGLLESYNSNGTMVGFVGANRDGDGLIRAANSKGDWVSRVGSGRDGNGLLEVLKSNGSLVKQIPEQGQRRAAAYQQKYPYLSSVTLPEGLIDFELNIPARDIVLVAPSANLVARAGLHHALVPLLLQTMEEVHERGGLLAQSEAFPSAALVDYPLNRDARQYFRAGPSLFYRYLPFWLAAWLDRVKLMLLPLCTLLIPLLKVAPPIYRWRIRSKIYRWYRVLREVDQKLKDAEPGTEFCQDIARLKILQTELADVSVPFSYMAEFYSLHLHISFVLERLSEQDSESGDTVRRTAA